MNKPILPILAATFILLMLVAAVVPVAAVTRLPTPTAKDPVITVVSIPEDDQLRNTGVMWFDPGALASWVSYTTSEANGVAGVLAQADYMRADPMWGATSPNIKASEATLTDTPIAKLDPIGAFLSTDTIFFFKKISQYKLMVTYQDGLPGASGYVGVDLVTLVNAGKATFQCDIYEKDKVEPKIPQDWSSLLSSLATKTSLADEYLKTSITDVSAFFVCKLRSSGEAGVYVVDLYYIGPQTSEYVSDLIVAFKVDLLPAATGLKTNAWGMDIQDLCILAWPFADPFRGGFIMYGGGGSPEWQKFPHLIPKPEHKWIWSSPDPLDGYSNCEEAVMFQRWLMGATIPIGV